MRCSDLSVSHPIRWINNMLTLESQVIRKARKPATLNKDVENLIQFYEARPATQRNDTGITITRYNEAHDVEDLIQFYGAKPARRRGLYFCPFHPDEHASLQVYTARGRRYIHC